MWNFKKETEQLKKEKEALQFAFNYRIDQIAELEKEIEVLKEENRKYRAELTEVANAIKEAFGGK